MDAEKPDRHKRKDPRKDGPKLFDGDQVATRRRLAVGCLDGARASELGEVARAVAVNVKATAETMVSWGVLEKTELIDNEASYIVTQPWRGPVDQARRRALRGRLQDGTQLVLVTRPTAPALDRLIADREPDSRLAWIARLSDSTFARLVALDERISEEAIERLLAEFGRAGVDGLPLKLGRLAGFDELRGFAAASVPGAFGYEP